MADYDREAARLRARYNDAVGWCLQYGIKVYDNRGDSRSLGELEDDIRDYRTNTPGCAEPPVDDTQFMRALTTSLEQTSDAVARRG